MVQAENIDSGISNFQLDNCSGRDHHSLAHLPKFTLSGAGAPAPHYEARLQFFDKPGWRKAAGRHCSTRDGPDLRWAARSDSQLLNSTCDQSQNNQQDHRADEGVDDRCNNASANDDADLRQQPASDQTATCSKSTAYNSLKR